MHILDAKSRRPGIAAPGCQLSFAALTLPGAGNLVAVDVEPDVNVGLVKLARVLLKRQPTLLDGTEVDGHMNDACTHVVQKWIQSFMSFYPDDCIAIGADFNSYFPNSGTGSPIRVSLQTQCEGSFSLKKFVDSDVDYRLATEAIRALNAVAYEGLEIWTPEVIFSAYAYHEWFGEEDDDGFRDAWQEHNDEPIEENCGRLIPSAWFDTLASSGYLPLGFQPLLKPRELAAYRKSTEARVVALAKAISTVFALAAKERPPNSNEDYTEKLEASFCFLWDEDDMLADAMDEVLNQRWNCGEATEAQFGFEIGPNTLDTEIEQDIRYLEHLITVQLAVGNLRKAMVAFLP